MFQSRFEQLGVIQAGEPIGPSLMSEFRFRTNQGKAVKRAVSAFEELLADQEQWRSFCDKYDQLLHDYEEIVRREAAQAHEQEERERRRRIYTDMQAQEQAALGREWEYNRQYQREKSDREAAEYAERIARDNKPPPIPDV